LFVLTWALVGASVTKLSSRAQFSRTLVEIFGATRGTRFVANCVICIEWAVGTSLAVAPASAYADAAVVALFATFAAVGAFALIAGRRVDCSCFGPFIQKRLGWIQLVQLPIAILVVFALRVSAIEPPLETSLAIILAAHLASAGALLGWALPTWSTARSQRTSLAEGLVFPIVAGPEESMGR
jgi:hypothetical protein